MVNKQTNYNSQEMWNTLLTQREYLLDKNPLVIERMKQAGLCAQNSNRIINIGSGQGFFESVILKTLKYEIFVDTDISIEGLEHLSNYPVSRLNSSITSMPFKDKSFDFIICLEVLEHLSRNMVKNAYMEIKRISDDSSHFLLSVPVYEPVSLVNHPVGHLRKYTPNEFLKELEFHGFEIEKIFTFYAFSKLRNILSFISKKLALRRPSVIMVLCRIKKS